FHEFHALKNKEIEHQILALASRAKIDNSSVYEVNMSQDTNTLNAYVTGFGATKRIVLWDTTLAKMPAKEILFVMGHEMGHFVLNHVWWSLLFSACFCFVFFYLTYLIANVTLRHFHQRFGFSKLSDIASFPLLVLISLVLLFLFQPINNLFSRHIEHEADRFGLELTKDNQAAGESFLILEKNDLVIPRPGWLYTIWRGTHPSLGERIDFFNHYCPWQKGEDLHYEKLIKP
ncbi:MAG TPA: M48 family metalloprotease, partial [Myxococcota bacterium]|nr:M48 family metalloprotease [Myxococcota bacterium]